MRMDALLGTHIDNFVFPKTDIKFVLPSPDASNVIIGGHTGVASSAVVAHCAVGSALLSCAVKALPNTIFNGGSHVPSVRKMVFIGAYNTQTYVAVWNVVTDTYKSYLYTTNNKGSVHLQHIHSVANYVGSFVGGTYITEESTNFIYAGVVRTDSGMMPGMYIAPRNRLIWSSEDLVNAMVLEEEKPDMFIAGGLELSDGAGKHAFIVRCNSLYYSILYGMRYRLYSTEEGRRRLYDQTAASVVKGMARINTALFMVVSSTHSAQQIAYSTTHILKVNMATGQILKQVQLVPSSSGLNCSHIIAAGQSLVMSCIMITQALLISMDTELTLSKLPVGFRRYENNSFFAESVAFHRTMLPVTATTAEINIEEGTITNDTTSPLGQLTAPPSETPSVQPSGQPSSCPTAAPSVSPQPTCHPSTSGPTNTYKPTVKLTQRLSRVPSNNPTLSPTTRPTVKPTLRPSLLPTVNPSNQPTAAPTCKPTRGPTAIGTRLPSVLVTIKPTAEPSATPTMLTKEVPTSNTRAYLILGYVATGLIGLWLLYVLRAYCADKVAGVQSDANRTLYVESIADKPKPRFPIFTFIVGLFTTIQPVEVDFIPVGTEIISTVSVTQSTAAPILPTTFVGVGANAESAGHLQDLEANTPRNSNTSNASASLPGTLPAAVAPSYMSSSAESSACSCGSSLDSDVDVILSPESSYISDGISQSSWDDG